MPDLPPSAPMRDTFADRKAGTATDAKTVFYHGRVLRAGWGLLLFLVIFYATVIAESMVVYKHVRIAPHVAMIPQDALAQMIALIAALVATIVPSYLEQRRVNDYGFRDSAWPGLPLGVVSGGVIVLVLALALRWSGLLAPVNVRTPWVAAVKPGLVWLGIFFVTALLEEVLLRGYLLYTLTRALAFLYRRMLGFDSGVAAAFWTSAVSLSAVFAWIYSHNLGQTRQGLACLFAMGLLYSFTLWRTGSLWWALGFHTLWDWVQAWVFGLPAGGTPIRDSLWSWGARGASTLSGGTAGLDGSLFAFVGLALGFAVVLVVLKPQTMYPELWETAAIEGRRMAERTLPDPG